MGLAAGGRMKQKIYKDSYGIDTWDRNNTSRVFVHLVNSQMWREITGEEAPGSPVTAREYEQAGLPWYDLYDEGQSAICGGGKLKGVKSVAQMDVKNFGQPVNNQDSVSIDELESYALKDKNGIYDGNW